MSALVDAAREGDRERVADALDRFFAERRNAAARFGPDFAHLWDQAHRATAGGKRVRPALLLAAHEGLGGAGHDAAVMIATAFELLHTAFLLHDDVIDGDTRRRGEPNLIGVFRDGGAARGLPPTAALAWGQAAAILAGDLLIPAAISLTARAPVTPDRRERLLDLLDETVLVTAAGELDDVGLGLGVRGPTLSDALTTAARKTAHYTFQAPLRAGAILAGADETVLAALDRYGHHAGLAFQLRDDLLGTFGDPGLTGKSASTDIAGGKITPLTSYALASSLGGRVQALLDRSQVGDVRVDDVRDVLERSGARTFVAQLVEEHIRDAISALDDAHVPGGLRGHLSAVAREAGGRSR